MATNLSRLIRSLPRLARTGSEPATRSGANSASRLACSSATQKPESSEERERVKEERETESEERERVEERGDVGDDVDKKRAEIGGPSGPEPTRYCDWERNGRCYDF